MWQPQYRQLVKVMSLATRRKIEVEENKKLFRALSLLLQLWKTLLTS